MCYLLPTNDLTNDGKLKHEQEVNAEMPQGTKQWVPGLSDNSSA
jgi:hypothetical protein